MPSPRVIVLWGAFLAWAVFVCRLSWLSMPGSAYETISASVFVVSCR